MNRTTKCSSGDFFRHKSITVPDPHASSDDDDIGDFWKNGESNYDTQAMDTNDWELSQVRPELTV